jgi:hypothetical protein
MNLARHAPSPCRKWMPTPEAEPVAAFVAARVALAPAQTPHVLRFAAELEPALYLAPVLTACSEWIRGAALEPASGELPALVAPIAATAAHAPLFAAGLEAAPAADTCIAAGELWTPGFTRKDVQGVDADAPAAACASVMDSRGGPVEMLAAEFVAELEPLPEPDLPLVPPAICRRWMPSLTADPVCSYLGTSIASAIAVRPALLLPSFSEFFAAPRAALMAQAQPMSPSRELTACARPSGAGVPPGWITGAAAVAMPAVPQGARVLFAAARPASAPAPEAAERWLVPAQAAELLSMEHPPIGAVELGAAPAFLEPALAMGASAAGLGPVPAAPRSAPVITLAPPMTHSAAACLMPFAQAATQDYCLPSFIGARSMAPEVRKPVASRPRLVVPNPITTLAVTPPATAARRVETFLPQPGPLPVEFHSQRLRNSPVARPEWKTQHPALRPPRFLVQFVPEKFEEPVPLKSVRPEIGKLRVMPGVKRSPTVLMVAGRIAAGFLLVASLWVGVAHFRADRRLTAQQDPLSPARGTVAAVAPGARSAPAGPVAWIRHTIANRAALMMGDDFHGMENWVGTANERPTGWSRHPDGYMNTGALALFHPSLKFTDSRLEFFGQIESKSIGWTVHATDSMNYHAMKLTVVEAGIRPFVALVQYNVVGGKAGNETRTPLNIMVHNSRPLQFAVDVKGSRVVTSIDGEEVDSSFDNTLVAGGVGFFSDAGERARLYWMRVSRNDDWLGHVCALLADGTSEVAWLRGPALPGGAPVPGLPGDGDVPALAGVWLALPYFRASRSRYILNTWRGQPWNTQAEPTRAACQCRPV